MKKAEVKVGGVYRAKVSDKLTDVRIDKTNPQGGWDATNLATNKRVRIKSAQRLRAASSSKAATKAAAPATEDKPKRSKAATSTKKTTSKKKATIVTDKKPSGLDLAAKVLASAKEPLNAKTIAERAIAAGWETSGKTPHATLYAAMIREIRDKGKESRFEKVDRGLFKAGKGA